MLYALLIIIAIGVLLLSEEGKKILDYLGAVAVFAGCLIVVLFVFVAVWYLFRETVSGEDFFMFLFACAVLVVYYVVKLYLGPYLTKQRGKNNLIGKFIKWSDEGAERAAEKAKHKKPLIKNPQNFYVGFLVSVFVVIVLTLIVLAVFF